MNRLTALAAGLLISAPALAQTPLQDAFKTLSPDERAYFQHVTTLASPFFEGRAPGLHGNRRAAEYAEFNFRALGLTPAFPAAAPDDKKDDAGDGDAPQPDTRPWSSFRQPFSTGRETVATAQALTYTAGGKTVTLTPGADFAVRGTSGAGKAAGPLVFVGYGIASGNEEYATFAETDDLTGKVALLLRFEPLNDKGKSRWSDDGAFSQRSALAAKLRAVADRHPAAILLVSPPGVDDPRADTIEDTASSTGGTTMRVPVINLHVNAATRMLAAANAELAALRRAADEKGGVTAIDGLSVTIDAAVERRPNSTDNVAGILRGKGALAGDFLVIGAHYDHVGFGLFGSRTNETGRLHPGADDNASGTAGLILLASKLAADYAKLPETASARSIIFVAFSGEEGGLIGSRHFVRNSPVEASRVYAMLNMDMIGRPRHDAQGRPKCQIEGVETARGFKDYLKPLFDDSGVAVQQLPGGRGPSDHASFYRASVPVLHFFTGLHDQYHTPRDTYDLIEPKGAVTIVELVRSVAGALARRTEPLEFTKSSGTSIDYAEPTEDAPAAPSARVPATAAPKPTEEPALLPRRRARTQPPEPPPAAPAPSAPAATPASDEPPAPTRSGMRVRFGIAPGDYDGSGGVLVGDVYPNTSAAEAGIKTGDLIVKWNDTALTGVQDWMPLLTRASPGDKVRLTVKRGPETLTLDCTLKARGD